MNYLWSQREDNTGASINRETVNKNVIYELSFFRMRSRHFLVHSSRLRQSNGFWMKLPRAS